MTNIEPRVAIVTGASKGIGAAIAQRLSADGISVVVNYANSAADADRVVAAIKQAGGNALAVKADIGSRTGMTDLFDAAGAAFGKIDILVNNAGIMQLSPLVETSDESFENQINTNLSGVFRGMREAGRRMKDGGRIINFSSSVVGLYQPAYAVYAATKAAVEAMTHVFAKEMGTRGITVNAVAPGPVETDLFMKGKNEAVVNAIIAMNPLKRLGQPQDIANVVAFLAGPDSGWVNGQVIRANGGVI
ncbi:SDR family oxidoreductase [Neorhizobium alkalisoli]|uniref:3-oxoacyl-[acyl-carrier protein] reductase n=1 Tax=Neorhizobium alkalisoli TaxID=528178 RepID=A0A561R8F1_9HYPH|nr:SDR family oxidoreductase [Neorhizobium alkalisoli]TWF58892.1 3-oxoacyl-[acyl-carrier protein] reductase [Neorhizobium alkalisoli]